MKNDQWSEIVTAVYRASALDGPRARPTICVVPTRYQGCYEGGRFAALPADDLDSEAFGQDCAAGDWWHYNVHRVGVGQTPNDALLDWYEKNK